MTDVTHRSCRNKHLALNYDDDSLAERLMKLGAQEQQIAIEDFKKALIENVDKQRFG